MKDHDPVLQGRLSEQEATRPRWLPLRPDLFPVGTVGHSLLTASFELLKGRERPETVFDKPLFSRVPPELQDRGIVTIRHIMLLPQNEVKTLRYGRIIQERVDGFIKNLVITPHARLLSSVFGEKQEPVVPDVEKELIRTVEAQLATLPAKRQQEVLIERFGLHDGIAKSIKEVGELPQFRVTRERIRQIEAKVLRILRHPSRSRHLKAYLQFPKESLGRRVFGNALRKDLPPLETPIGDLELSETVKQELRANWSRFDDESIESFARTAVSEFSPEAVSEIASALRTYVARQRENAQSEILQEETQAPKEIDVSVAPSAQEQIRKSLVNNLLPELIPSEKLAAVAGIRIDHLDLNPKLKGTLRKYKITTVGDVLRLTGREFGTMRNMGLTYAQQLGEKLEELLELPQSAYQKGRIPFLLVRALAEVKWRYAHLGRAQDTHPEYNTLAMQRAELQAIVQSFTKQGITDPAEIQRHLIERNQRLLGEYADSLKARALIEYALNRPEER